MLDYVIDNSELIGEWNWEKNNTLGFYPQKLSCGSGKKVWWKCQKGHEWQAVIGSRNNGYGCPFCSGLRVLRGVNDLETVNPELCKEWNYKRNIGISPDLFFPNSDKKVWWKCELGHEWQASIGHRNKGRGCPICAGKQVLTGFNDLASTNPEVAKEWEVERNMGVTPENVTPNSHKKAWWKCSVCGNEWQAIISERNRGYGCPKCGVRKMAHSRRCNQIEEKGSLEQNNPDLAKEWLYAKNGELKPSDVLQNSPQKVWWKCRDCGHEWAAQIKVETAVTVAPNVLKLIMPYHIHEQCVLYRNAIQTWLQNGTARKMVLHQTNHFVKQKL